MNIAFAAGGPGVPAPPRCRLGTAEDILIVEDHYDNRTLLEEAFASVGWRAHSVASGEEALERLADPACAPAIVLVDVRLRGMSGIELYARIALDPLLARTPVVFLTADILAARRIREAMRAPVLEKPIDIDRLIRSLSAAAGVAAA